MLIDLLRLPERPLIALVGAGGKTTTMYTLARELTQQGRRVIATTTTNIYFPERGQGDALVIAGALSTLVRTVQSIPSRHQRITVAARVTEAGKLAGLSPHQPYELLMRTDAAAVIVEADGARGRMIKAPADHEPIIPPRSNIVLIMMSAEAINRPLSAAIAHRPERIAALLDIKQGGTLTPERIARLIASEQGGLKNIPEQAGVYVLITHISNDNLEGARKLAVALRDRKRLAGVLCSPEASDWWSFDT